MSKAILASVLLLVAVQAHAAAPEKWSATSNTATSITGDVTMAPDKITFAGNKFLPVAPAIKVSTFIGNGRQTDASVFKVTKPADLQLVRGNRLCDGHAVTYIVVWNSPKVGGDVAPVTMEPFYGAAMPKSESDPLSCGTFTYETGRH